MTRCEKTELEPEQCAHCRGLDLPKIKEHQTQHRMDAKFNGHCEDCGRRIETGDPLIRTTDNMWICGQCAGDETC